MPRKLRTLDLGEVEVCAELQATTEEIAAHFKMTKQNWLKSYANKAEVIEALERGKANGKLSLRRAQRTLAMKGNATMLIWLGKQYLGQRDIVVTPDGGGAGVETADDARALLMDKIAKAAAAKAEELAASQNQSPKPHVN